MNIDGEQININIADNDISGVARGLVLLGFNLDGVSNAFNIYSNNSIHAVEYGIWIANSWNTSSVAAPEFEGNVFRQNNITDLIATKGGAAFWIASGSDGNSASGSDGNSGLFTMDVFDANIIAGVSPAFSFTLDAPDDAGIADMIFWNDFSSGDGTQASEGIVILDPNGNAIIGYTYPTLYFNTITDQWQGYYVL